MVGFGNIGSVLSIFKPRLGASPSSLDRASNFEVLRIAAMFMIVFHHFGSEETYQYNRELETYRWFNEYWIRSMATTGKCGANVFLLMTGYFMNGRPLKAASLARTWFQTDNWSYIISFIFWFKGYDIFERGRSEILYPILGHNYWFVSAYLAVGFTTGWIAAVQRYATAVQYVVGLGAMFMFMSIITWDTFVVFSNMQWFGFVMCLGGFIRRYSRQLQCIQTHQLVQLLVVLMLAVYWSTYQFMFYDYPWASRHGGHNALVRENWCPVALLEAVILLMLTERSPKFKSPRINRLAGLSLGVYLTHENILVRYRIWKDWVSCLLLLESPFMPIISVLAVVTVYLTCSFLELLRQTFFGNLETLVASYVTDVCDRMSNKINELDAQKEMV